MFLGTFLCHKFTNYPTPTIFSGHFTVNNTFAPMIQWMAG